ASPAVIAGMCGVPGFRPRRRGAVMTGDSGRPECARAGRCLTAVATRSGRTSLVIVNAGLSGVRPPRRSMSLRNDNLELVLAGWIDARRRNDVETIERHLHPDVVWHGLRPDLICANRAAVLDN